MIPHPALRASKRVTIIIFSLFFIPVCRGGFPALALIANVANKRYIEEGSHPENPASENTTKQNDTQTAGPDLATALSASQPSGLSEADALAIRGHVGAHYQQRSQPSSSSSLCSLPAVSMHLELFLAVECNPGQSSPPDNIR